MPIGRVKRLRSCIQVKNYLESQLNPQSLQTLKFFGLLIAESGPKAICLNPSLNWSGLTTLIFCFSHLGHLIFFFIPNIFCAK